MLGRFTEDLAALQRMVRYGDGDGLFELFTRTRAIRRGIIAQGPGDRRARFRAQTGRRCGLRLDRPELVGGFRKPCPTRKFGMSAEAS